MQTGLAAVFEGGNVQFNIADPQHSEFAKDCPIISNIIIGFGGFWPDEHVELLNSIISKCRKPFLVKPSRIQWRHGVTVDNDYSNDSEEQRSEIDEDWPARRDERPNMKMPSQADLNLLFWQLGEWYPHWPKYRACKKYSHYYTAVPEPADCM